MSMLPCWIGFGVVKQRHVRARALLCTLKRRAAPSVSRRRCEPAHFRARPSPFRWMGQTTVSFWTPTLTHERPPPYRRRTGTLQQGGDGRASAAANGWGGFRASRVCCTSFTTGLRRSRSPAQSLGEARRALPPAALRPPLLGVSGRSAHRLPGSGRRAISGLPRRSCRSRGAWPSGERRRARPAGTPLASRRGEGQRDHTLLPMNDGATARSRAPHLLRRGCCCGRPIAKEKSACAAPSARLLVLVQPHPRTRGGAFDREGACCSSATRAPLPAVRRAALPWRATSLSPCARACARAGLLLLGGLPALAAKRDPPARAFLSCGSAPQLRTQERAVLAPPGAPLSAQMCIERSASSAAIRDCAACAA